MIVDHAPYKHIYHLPIDEPTRSWGWLAVVVGLMGLTVYLIMAGL